MLGACSARACPGCWGANELRTSRSNWIAAVFCSGFAQGTLPENSGPWKILTRHSGGDGHVHGVPDRDSNGERADK
jgi:hypothetical protein